MVHPELRQPGSRFSTVVGFLLVAGVLTALGGCAPGERPRVVEPGTEHVAVGALGGRTGAYLTLRDAASRVRVVLATLPGLLYRISTPAGSGLTPRVSGRGGRVQAALLPTGGDGPDEVRIVLNRDVRWHIRLPAGAGEQQLDLRRGRVSGLGLGASGLIEMHLPRPAGTVPVVLESAAGTVLVTAPRAVPVRVQLAGGAGSVTVPWSPPGGAGPAGVPWSPTGPAPAGAVLQPPAFPAAPDRYLIRAEEAVGALVVRS